MRVFFVVLAMLVAVCGYAQDLTPRSELFGPFEVVRVIDGERFVIDLPDFDETVRLIGLDIRGQLDAAPTLGRMVTGRGVWLEVVEPSRDSAGNIQAYAYVLDPAGRWDYLGQRFMQVNRALGGQGYAGLPTGSAGGVFPGISGRAEGATPTGVRVSPLRSTIDVTTVGTNPARPLFYDTELIRPLGARPSQLTIRLLELRQPPVIGELIPGTPTPPFRTGENITNCRAFPSWQDAQAYITQLAPATQQVFDDDGDGVFCEILLLAPTCESFSDWQSAQNFYLRLGASQTLERSQLDVDGDGIACEILLLGGSSTTAPAIGAIFDLSQAGSAPLVPSSALSAPPQRSLTPLTTLTPPRQIATTQIVTMPEATGPTTPPAPIDCIDLNSASISELTFVVGITLFRADQIINARPYNDVVELTRVGFSAQEVANIQAQDLACVRAVPLREMR
ncbi:MAG: hypothetical protein AAF267_16680 [Deinococcota bacterium]